jgi:hypothetical protein
MGASVVALAGMFGWAALRDSDVPPPPPVRVIIDTPSDGFNPRYVGVSRALAIAEYAEGATAAEAEAAANALCETKRLARFNRGNYTVESCEQLLTLNNVFGPACGILFEQNVVGNIHSRLMTGPNEHDVQRTARTFIKREDPAIFNNIDNPRATAMQICVQQNGRVKYTDLSYELAR